MGDIHNKRYENVQVVLGLFYGPDYLLMHLYLLYMSFH